MTRVLGSRFRFGNKPPASTDGIVPYGRSYARQALDVDRGERVTIDRPPRRRFDLEDEYGSPVDLVTAMGRGDLSEGADDDD